MGQQKELEVTVLSAQDLKNVAMLGAMDPYCVAWLYPHTKVSGPVSKGGGVHPTWNAIITLVAEESLLEQGDAAVTVEIYNHSTFSNKLIGSAIVPLADVQGTSKAGTGSTKATAYQVRKKSGNYQGVINVAVKVGRTLSESEVAAKSGPPSMGMPAMAAMAGGQYGQQQQQYYPQQQQQEYYPQQQQQYYPQQQQPYYPQQQQQYYPQQQQQYAPPGQYSQAGYPPQQKPKRGFGGAGLGLGAGLLGGYVLGSALDGGDGGGDGGGCGGGGCGGGCGG